MSEHHEDHGHGFSHVMPPAILLGVFVALIVLTVVTVVVAGNPLIPPGFDIIVALSIATVKGALVVLFFMHMIYDKPLNAILFVFSLVFVALFLGFAISDTDQYQHRIEEYEYGQTEQAS
ncbi:cytochrome C oxidase subunit IV family protein [Rubinisphaera margarita]|uniref:cytochrome C oxidase subunit IV family protein n=1 Tax=Rubinisphaera margarita TaxID=2909586 RepID=UPI001EE929BB|nr:cytochrome C oxidase subunit IV family protein [Rubinisphaera margarita]MCG6157189.1 cytochrome C oxidase subunit IV family protein [Rubinisphaera margarita]